MLSLMLRVLYRDYGTPLYTFGTVSIGGNILLEFLTIRESYYLGVYILGPLFS